MNINLFYCRWISISGTPHFLLSLKGVNVKRLIILVAYSFSVLALFACGGGGGGGDDAIVVPPVKVVDTVEVADTVAPYVLSTIPEFNNTSVAINRAITVTFNEPIAPATITLYSILVDDEYGNAIVGAVEYDESSLTATFIPDSYLVFGDTYVATVTTDIEDLSGNTLVEDYIWQFTTSDADLIAPDVLSHYPAVNANSVALNTAIAVTFNEPIDPFTINAQALTLNGTAPVDGTVTYVGTTALFKPTANLMAGTVYTASVAGTIKDLAGNDLETTVEWKFTTGNQADVIGPLVLSVSPPKGEDDVPITSLMQVNFDESITPFEFGLIDGIPVTVTFNNDFTTATLKPTAGLRSGVTYSALIYVSDMAGILMDGPFVWEFSMAP